MSPRRVLAEHTGRELAEWMAFFALERRESEDRARQGAMKQNVAAGLARAKREAKSSR